MAEGASRGEYDEEVEAIQELVEYQSSTAVRVGSRSNANTVSVQMA
jgi:hypothetical protein